MLIRVLSDVHLSHFRGKWEKAIKLTVPPLDTDSKTVLCIAGDLSSFGQRDWIQYLKRLSGRFKAVIYVPGNHDWYGNSYFPNIPKHDIAENVYLLNKNHVIIDDTIFIGATLWTNFDYEDPLYMWHARKNMNDYNWIKKVGFDNFVNIIPEDTVKEFYESKDYIFKMISEFKQYKSVVVTHHVPTEKLVDEYYKGDILNHAYYSNLEGDIIQHEPNLWLCGHMHHRKGLEIGKTKLVLNPFGHLLYNEITDFDDRLVMEI